MQKYRWIRTLLSARTQVGMTYRVNHFVSMIIFIFPLIARIMLWKAIYSSQPLGAAIAGFSMADMVTYYVLFQMIFEISWCYVHVWVIPEIVSGELTRYLLLPVSYPVYASIDHLGGFFLPRFISTMIIFPPLMLLFRNDISLHFSATTALLGIASVMLCCIYLYAFHMCLGLMAFWFEERPPFAGVIEGFMGGAVIPIALMPGWLQHLCTVLPFKYSIYLPVQILMGRLPTSEALFGIGMQLMWICVFMLILKLMWKPGVRRYQGFGG
jgi:ABC-2 type transport system permease protein